MLVGLLTGCHRSPPALNAKPLGTALPKSSAGPAQAKKATASPAAKAERVIYGSKISNKRTPIPSELTALCAKYEAAASCEVLPLADLEGTDLWALDIFESDDGGYLTRKLARRQGTVASELFQLFRRSERYSSESSDPTLVGIERAGDVLTLRTLEQGYHPCSDRTDEERAKIGDDQSRLWSLKIWTCDKDGCAETSEVACVTDPKQQERAWKIDGSW
jgi:hypothetical protein